MKSDYATEAKRHRLQAEELRAKAELMADQDTRDMYLRLADSYDALAENENQIALNGQMANRQAGSGGLTASE